VVALVCNFAASSRSSPCLLAHHDVETLFHEFGHALHSLLSRTAFQHLSGTRAALDFVEVPSNLLEYFVWDHRFLGQFAVHHATGEPIPRSLVDSLRASKSMLAASDLQTQVVYSLMDQAYFGVNPPHPTSSLLTPSLSSQAAAAAMAAGAAAGGGAGGGGSGGSGRDTTAVMADLMGRYMGVAHVPGTYWQSRFAHLTAYGAGYYTYIYAKCFAAQLWRRLFKEDPLNPEAGEMLRSHLLRYGGAGDPRTLLESLLGPSAFDLSHGSKVGTDAGIIGEGMSGVCPRTDELLEDMEV
ncbi:unnamed protein product, partial [Closterium sp. NIES-54]